MSLEHGNTIHTIAEQALPLHDMFGPGLYTDQETGIMIPKCRLLWSYDKIYSVNLAKYPGWEGITPIVDMRNPGITIGFTGETVDSYSQPEDPDKQEGKEFIPVSFEKPTVISIKTASGDIKTAIIGHLSLEVLLFDGEKSLDDPIVQRSLSIFNTIPGFPLPWHSVTEDDMEKARQAFRSPSACGVLDEYRMVNKSHPLADKAVEFVLNRSRDRQWTPRRILSLGSGQAAVERALCDAVENASGTRPHLTCVDSHMHEETKQLLTDAGCEIHIQDMFAFLQAHSGEYDLITMFGVSFLFNPENFDRIFFTPEEYLRHRAILRTALPALMPPGSILLTNIVKI